VVQHPCACGEVSAHLLSVPGVVAGHDAWRRLGFSEDAVSARRRFHRREPATGNPSWREPAEVFATVTGCVSPWHTPIAAILDFGDEGVPARAPPVVATRHWPISV